MTKSLSLTAWRLRQQHQRWRAFLSGLLLLPILVALSLMVGAKPIPSSVVLDALLHFDASDSDHLLIWHLRVPRTLVALLVGGGLGLSGAIMQALTRNPLADPGLLGINAGAAAAIVAAIAFWGVTDLAGQLWAGWLGAGIAALAVYLLGGLRQGINPVRVVLAGAALTVVLLALAQIIIINSDELLFDQFRHWAVGSLQGRGAPVLLPLFWLVLLGLGLAIYLIPALDTLTLGGDLGRALGVHPLMVWLLASLAILTLAGAATAAAGPISFVGLTAPHIARLIAGPGHRWLLPYTFLIAALLVLAADILGRWVAHPDEVGVGIMVALLGGPVFVLLARRHRMVQL